jgi:pimeloyl-ACP methyl ester carboxylesterase
MSPVTAENMPDDVTTALIRQLDGQAQHHKVDSSSCTVKWRQWGKGEPLVLIHGGHGSWLHWVRNIEALAAQHTVWVPDLPGFGESDTLPGDPHDPDRQSRLLGVLQDSLDQLLGPTTLIDLAGFSFGGMVAGQLAIQRGAVRRLALLGSAGHGGTRRQTTPLINWRVPQRAERLAAMRQNLAAFMLHNDARIDELALLVHEQASLATRYRSKAVARLPVLVQALETFNQPVLLLWGEHDVTAVPEEAAHALLQNRPEREWELLPGAGHWVQYELAHAVNERLKRWFASVR